MMRQPGRWTRREFSAAVAGVLGTSCLFGEGQPTQHSIHAARSFAYIGSTTGGAGGVLHVFDTDDEDWRPLQTLQAVAPTHMERHPSLPAIYVLHGVDIWEHLPRGAVSAYSVEPKTGCLTLLNTQPLSLSSIGPRHATVSYDGGYLIVAAETGGSYNLLPIAEDGRLMAPASARKGMGIVQGKKAKTARPQYVLRHPDGRTILTTDAGSEEIQSFSIEDSLLSLRHRIRVHPGTGASQIILSKDGLWLYAMNAADGSLSLHMFDSSTGQVSAEIQRMRADSPGERVMAIHPSGRFLIAAGSGRSAIALTAYGVDVRNGCLTLAQSAPQLEPVRATVFSSDGRRLVSIGSSSGKVFQVNFDVETGIVSNRRTLSRAENSSCLLLHSA